LEARAIKLKLSYFGHVIRADGLEKDFMVGMARMGNGTKFDLLELTPIARYRKNWRELVWLVTKDRYRSDGTRCTHCEGLSQGTILVSLIQVNIQANSDIFTPPLKILSTPQVERHPPNMM